MTANKNFDAIIIGGSYAGLSAGMALGRSLRQVLIIDSGKPCNRQTPHSHNFITQDGQTPAQIARTAKEQVSKYETVRFYNGLAMDATKTTNGFEVKTEQGDLFTAKKLLFATGVSDQMPPIEGFSECWGISVLHCPYCHGYEVKGEIIGLLGNGDTGFEFCRLISNWSKNLILFTNGPSTLAAEQAEKIKSYKIPVIETEISKLQHESGHIENIILTDGSTHKLTALFARPALKQHCEIPEQLGCELTEQGLIKVDEFQRTTVPGVFAAGDNATMLRAVSLAVAAGTRAGALLNKEIIDEEF